MKITLLSNLVSAIDKVLKFTMQFLLVAITAVVTWQVLSRYVIAEPSSITEELSRFLLIWLTLLGSAYAYRLKAHLGLDLLYLKSNPIERTVMYRIIHLSVAVFAVLVMIIGGSELVSMTDELAQMSPVMGIKISSLYQVIPVSGCLILIYSIDFLLQSPAASSQEQN